MQTIILGNARTILASTITTNHSHLWLGIGYCHT
ncbi:Uncharacterised protein [Segatella copri]|nr:Uncharacterised protein [Segatella copri]